MCQRPSRRIGAPKFLSIDVAQKAIAGPKRTTTIAFIEKGADQIVLQGNELGFGWTIALDQESGEMSLRSSIATAFLFCSAPAWCPRPV
jgi:hypothetical protein